MKRLLLATVAAAALCAPARAADLPYKAAPAPVGLWDTGGWYVSLNSGAEVAQANVSGGSNTFLGSFAAGKVQANGGVVGVGVGAMYGNPASWKGWECDVYYRNISAGIQTTAGSAGVASRWEGSCGVRIGFDPSVVTDLFSGLGFSGITLPTFHPIPPPGVQVASTTRSFLEAGGSATGVSGDFGVGGGATVAWGPYLKVGTLFQPVNALTGKPSAGVIEVSLRAALYDKGFEFTNFLDPQHNVVFAGQSHLTRAYMLELDYKFAPTALSVLASR